MKQPERQKTIQVVLNSRSCRYAIALSIAIFKQSISEHVDSVLAKFNLCGERIAKFEEAVRQILRKYHADGFYFYGDNLLMSGESTHQWIMELLHDHQYLHEKPTII